MIPLRVKLFMSNECIAGGIVGGGRLDAGAVSRRRPSPDLVCNVCAPLGTSCRPSEVESDWHEVRSPSAPVLIIFLNLRVVGWSDHSPNLQCRSVQSIEDCRQHSMPTAEVPRHISGLRYRMPTGHSGALDEGDPRPVPHPQQAIDAEHNPFQACQNALDTPGGASTVRSEFPSSEI